jgi:hypothetical protein
MVTGQQGFSGGSSAEIFDEILNRAPIAPVRLNPAVPAETRTDHQQGAREKSGTCATSTRLKCAPICSG